MCLHFCPISQIVTSRIFTRSNIPCSIAAFKQVCAKTFRHIICSCIWWSWWIESYSAEMISWKLILTGEGLRHFTAASVAESVPYNHKLVMGLMKSIRIGRLIYMMYEVISNFCFSFILQFTSICILSHLFCTISPSIILLYKLTGYMIKFCWYSARNLAAFYWTEHNFSECIIYHSWIEFLLNYEMFLARDSLEHEGKSSSVVIARIVFSVLGFLMLGTLIYTLLTDGSPFRKELLTP